MSRLVQYICVHKNYTESLHEQRPHKLAVSSPVLKFVWISKLVGNINWINLIFIYTLQLSGIELYTHLLISCLVIDILLIDATHQLLICYTHKMNRLSVKQTVLHKNKTLNTPLKHNNLCLPLHDIIFFWSFV